MKIEMETTRAIHALLRLSIAASSEHPYSELYENSTVEDAYFYVLNLILNNNEV